MLTDKQLAGKGGIQPLDLKECKAGQQIIAPTPQVMGRARRAHADG